MKKVILSMSGNVKEQRGLRKYRGTGMRWWWWSVECKNYVFILHQNMLMEKWMIK